MSRERGTHRLATIQVAGKLGSLVFQLGFLAVVARAFGADLFGAFAAGWALVVVAAAVADFALPTLTILELADRDRPVVERSALAALAITTSLATVGIVVVAVLALPVNSRAAALALVGWMIFGRLRTLGQAFRQADYEVGRIVAGEVTSRTVALAGAVAVYGLELGFEDAVVVLGLTMSAGEVLASVIVWTHRPRFGTLGEGLTLLRRGRDLGLTTVASTTHSRVDQVLFGSLRVEAAGGPYAVAYRLVDAALAVVVAAGGVVLPVLTMAQAAVRTKVSRGLTSAALGFGVLAGAGLFVAAPVLVAVIGGDGFETAVPLLRVLAIVLVISVTNMPLSQLVIVEHGAGVLLRLSCVAITLNIAMNLVLIPRYGAGGAAVTTLVTEAFGLVAVAAIAESRRPGVVPIRELLMVAAICAAAFGMGSAVGAAVHPVAGAAVGLVAVSASLVPLFPQVMVLRQAPAELTADRAVVAP